MGQIVSLAAKPKRCNLNQLGQMPTPAAGEYILVSTDNSMNAAGQGYFDSYVIGDGTTAATALTLHKFKAEELDVQLNENINNYTLGAYLSKTDVVVEENGFCYSDYIDVEASKAIRVNYGTLSQNVYILEYDSSKELVNFYTQLATTTYKSWTTSSNAAYIRFSWNVGQAVNVRQNNTTIYEPYSIFGLSTSVINAWVLTEAYSVSSCVRNSDGDVSSAFVVWPDNKSGTIAVTRNSYGSPISIVATHESYSYTITITRDSNDYVTSSSITRN